jgi:DNA-binding response OmpR family regulator
MIKIMHVDDEPDTVELVRTILEHEGFKVVSAYSGKECLEKLDSIIKLVLLDIMMPDMSGWEVYLKIRKNRNNVKVAFLSAIDVSEERRRILFKNGIADYITKPFDNQDLVRRVKKIVEK